MSATEERHRVRLPDDMRAFYRLADGMDWPTGWNHGWLRIWTLDEWHRVRDEPARFHEMAGPLRIYLVDGVRQPKLVAESFTTFVNAALADARHIYPGGGPA